LRGCAEASGWLCGKRLAPFQLFYDEPGSKCSWLPQVSEMEVDVKKRLLGGLTCEFNIAEPTHRECHGEALEPDNKHGKRCVITALCCAHDLAEVDRTA
jgi:hypothetical protein